ncbi:MAG TPA: squalene/phytoene synthase family protein [Bdellovibrionales bacterium]|nr:squalene/phytoene synthase family protein [Bdellovibrionales bacterium]
MERPSEFYQSHLDRVSRSFAFCIRQLPEPLRAWVAMSYLLCRILDTIEDAPWSGSQKQFEAFTLFDHLLSGDVEPERAFELLAALPAEVAEGEMALIGDAPAIFEDLALAPAQVSLILRELIGTMSRGMQHFARRHPGGALELTSIHEVNQYCFFVAGVVGELLAKLLRLVDGDFKIDETTLVRAHHFGLFLQKVNLLKDQVGDEKAGRRLVPSRELVESSARHNAEGALSFLQSLPAKQLEFRRFCAWSLFLGLEALAVARDSVRQGQVLKVSRERVEELITLLESSLTDDQALRRLYETVAKRLGWGAALAEAPKSSQVPEWLQALYPGPLSPQKLAELGV